MLVMDGKAVKVRWGDYASELFGAFELICETCDDDYQGSASFWAFDPGTLRGVVYLQWSWGSCSGCDQWEDRPDDEVRQGMRNCAMQFSDFATAIKAAQRMGSSNMAEEFLAWCRSRKLGPFGNGKLPEPEQHADFVTPPDGWDF